jgi:hypothetical protein
MDNIIVLNCLNYYINNNLYGFNKRKLICLLRTICKDFRVVFTFKSYRQSMLKINIRIDKLVNYYLSNNFDCITISGQSSIHLHPYRYKNVVYIKRIRSSIYSDQGEISIEYMRNDELLLSKLYSCFVKSRRSVESFTKIESIREILWLFEREGFNYGNVQKVLYRV